MPIADIKDESGKWLPHVKTGRNQYVKTRLGSLWGSIKYRTSQRRKDEFPGDYYTDVTCGFLDFEDFSLWCENQVGFNNEGWQLDKDILSEFDQKLYSKDTCVFVPCELNQFFRLRKKRKNDLPSGVTIYGVKKECYIAQLAIRQERIILGIFETPAEASVAYKNAKCDHARKLAKKWYGLVDDRVVYLLENFEQVIDKFE